MSGGELSPESEEVLEKEIPTLEQEAPELANSLEVIIGESPYVWNLSATLRGKMIEKALAESDYEGWYNIGQENNGYFPIIDFQNGSNVVSLKTLDPRLPSYSGSGATNKVLDYLNQLDTPILVNDNPANKILDERIPGGTINKLDLETLQNDANQRGIQLIIKEYK